MKDIAPQSYDPKEQTRLQWNTTPCGTGDYLAGLEPYSREYFDAIRTSRYEVTDPWMKEVIPFELGRGKKVLEIGHGIGSDLLSFSEAGAEVYGIDITERHHILAEKNFITHNRKATLKTCDASKISFPDEHFDIVYSHGVLHHTPDTIRCIGEAYRVLKNGGILILSLYYRYSAFHMFSKILWNGLLNWKLFSLGYDGLMATVENGADGVKIKPLVKTYSKRQLKVMLADFSSVSLRLAHFRTGHIPFVGSAIPASWERSLGKVLGWYVVASAKK